MKRLLVGVTAALAVAAFAAPATAAGKSLGPPAGTFYANDQVFKTILTPTSIPNTGPFDTLYMIPGFAPVSDAAPGAPGYNGGRWMVVNVTGTFTSQPTNAAQVLANATSIQDTGVRFVCPLIKA
jgi:hypothetical protein